MPYVLARAAAYYSPLAGGVVDFPTGLKLQQVDGILVSNCGTKAIHDPEVVARLVRDGSLCECEDDAADAEAESGDPADAGQGGDAPSQESPPAAGKPAPRKPGRARPKA